MRQYERMREAWDTDAVEPITDFLHAGDRVVLRFHLRGVGHGPETTLEMTSVFTVRKGKVIFVEFVWDHAEALEAAGLSE